MMTHKYPEHEKMHEARAQGSDEIGQFLEWLRNESPYIIAEREQRRACEFTTYGWAKRNEVVNCENGRLVSDERSDYAGEDQGECTVCNGTGVIKPEDPMLLPASISILDLLSTYFDIDQNKIEEEKRAMLNTVRGLNETEESNREA